MLHKLPSERPELATAGSSRKTGAHPQRAFPPSSAFCGFVWLLPGMPRHPSARMLCQSMGAERAEFDLETNTDFGSSMHFLGNAAVLRGKKFEFRPPRPYKITDRQLEASQAFLDSFGQVDGATFLERHALALCCKYNKDEQMQGMQVATTCGIKECIVLQTHKFLVSALALLRAPCEQSAGVLAEMSH
ncbi:unnamed protein product [Polarella glacialis]|nr:unnamed protein product [Polarella glacialis]